MSRRINRVFHLRNTLICHAITWGMAIPWHREHMKIRRIGRRAGIPFMSDWNYLPWNPGAEEIDYISQEGRE